MCICVFWNHGILQIVLQLNPIKDWACIFSSLVCISRYMIRTSCESENITLPEGHINNIPSLARIMDWRWPGDKPLSEPMMVRFPTHTQPKWVINRSTTISRYIALTIKPSPSEQRKSDQFYSQCCVCWCRSISSCQHSNNSFQIACIHDRYT